MKKKYMKKKQIGNIGVNVTNPKSIIEIAIPKEEYKLRFNLFNRFII
jgi:hypothetical protein